MNPYISEQNSSEFTFYRVPKALVDDPRYRSVSTDAKLLYGRRKSHRIRRHSDPRKKPRKALRICPRLNGIALSKCKEKACKLMRELEDTRLIERCSQGHGRPDRIYLRRFEAVENGCERSEKQDTCAAEWSENQDTGAGKRSEKQARSGRKNRPPEVGKSDPNKTEKSKTDFSKIHLSSPEPMMEDEIREQIEYETLVRHYPTDTLDCMVSLIADVERSTAPTLRIGKEDVPRAKVLAQFRELDRFHIEYIFDCLEESCPNIRNIRAYLLTALYRAPETMESYYAAKVAHDEGCDVHWAQVA